LCPANARVAAHLRSYSLDRSGHNRRALTRWKSSTATGQTSPATRLLKRVRSAADIASLVSGCRRRRHSRSASDARDDDNGDNRKQRIATGPESGQRDFAGGHGRGKAPAADTVLAARAVTLVSC